MIRYTYLKKSFERLSDWLPYDVDELLRWYQGDGVNDATVEETNGYVYVLFNLPVLTVDGSFATLGDTHVIERTIVLVFHGDDIVGDCSGFHTDVPHFMLDENVIRLISYESDWSFLSGYTLSGICFSDYGNSYDPSVDIATKAPEGEVFLYHNAYVTIAYRKQNIFTIMTEMVKENALRHASGTVSYYAIMSMDPDIPVYGPDATDEPYYYTYAVDEPKRMVNKEILERMGWTTVRLNELDPDEKSNGEKLWFGIRSEIDSVIITDQIA